MGRIHRDLPNNAYLAAVNANLPSAVNPYATIADLPAATVITNNVIPKGNGTGIIDGTWQNVGNNIYPTTTGSNIGDATHRIGTLFMSSTIDHSTDLNLFSGAVNYNTFLANGQVDLAKTAQRVRIGDPAANLVTISGGITQQSSLAVGTTWTGFYAYNNSTTPNVQVALVANRFGLTSLRVSHDFTIETGWTGGMGTSSSAQLKLFVATGNLSLGTVVASIAKLSIRGNGTTSGTQGLSVADSIGSAKFIVNDAGQTAWNAGSTASFITTFGHYIQSSGYDTGLAVYGRNGTRVSLSVQHTSTTVANAIAVDVAFQNAQSGIVTGTRSSVTGLGHSNGRAFHGISRNSTANSYAIFGENSGGATIAEAGIQAALYGDSHGNLDTTRFGLYAIARADVAGQTLTKPITGVYGLGQSTATSTSTVAGLKGEVTGLIGTGQAISIWSPAGSNIGKVVFGSNNVSGGSTLQVTGELELFGNGTGFYMYQPDGTRRSITLNNAGAFVIA